ncbi:MAG TPA: hypothetical protein VEG68_02060 [Terriglobales bacterium]|nr:hypothetical protein [Terriglobales bacterium]
MNVILIGLQPAKDLTTDSISDDADKTASISQAASAILSCRKILHELKLIQDDISSYEKNYQ